MPKIAEVIKYEGDNSTFIWKHPLEDFNSLTQLVVHESQEAIFMMNGQALDLFGPGRYTLETQNIPLISKYINKTTGDKTPFHCEVYFINKTEQMAIKWGTNSKVQFMEPTYNFPISIGASGEMSLRAEDSRKLLVKLVGTENFLGQDNLVRYFRAFLISSLNEAIELFSQIPEWRDASDKIDELKKIKKILSEENNRRKKKIITAAICAFVIVFICSTLVLITTKVIIPNNKYNTALALLNDGNKDSAYSTFAEIKSYKDSDEKMSEIMNSYFISQKPYIAAGYNYTIGLKNDGTLISAGSNDSGQCDVSDWKDIVAVSAGNRQTVGIKSDGTVVAAGSNDYGECNIEDWKDIKQISAGHCYTVGLKNDGTVIVTGSGDYGQCGVTSWKEIVSISAGFTHTVGLKSDGTVVAVGNNNDGQCDVSNWKDIVAVSSGDYHTVGLKSDGTVVATGENDYGQCDVSNWKDIVAISSGNCHTVGLKSDGTVVAAGNNDNGQCDVDSWNNIRTK